MRRDYLIDAIIVPKGNVYKALGTGEGGLEGENGHPSSGWLVCAGLQWRVLVQARELPELKMIFTDKLRKEVSDRFYPRLGGDLRVPLQGDRSLWEMLLGATVVQTVEVPIFMNNVDIDVRVKFHTIVKL